MPTTLSFPADHGPHAATIEWWYWNGHLTDADGGKYSYMDCLFKADIEKVDLPYLRHLPLKKMFGGEKRYAYFAHSVVTNLGNGKSYKEIQNISLVSTDSFKRERLFVDYEDPIIVKGFVNHEMAELADDSFHVKTSRLDLALTPKKKPLLEGGKGYVSVCGRKSYYYSLTDLTTSGYLTIDSKRIKVEGRSWMDHQWADVSYKQDRWTWFSIQLDNGTDIMCCEYDDSGKKDALVDIITGSGRQSQGKNLILKPGNDIWKSLKTKRTYPMSWDIKVPDRELQIHVKAMAHDQEIVTMSADYWEGPIEVTATIGVKKVKGLGFMELVGYHEKELYF